VPPVNFRCKSWTPFAPLTRHDCVSHLPKPPEADKLVGSKFQLHYSVQEAAHMLGINQHTRYRLKEHLAEKHPPKTRVGDADLNVTRAANGTRKA